VTSLPYDAEPMPDSSLLETFSNPAEQAYVIEHVSEEFTSVCPMTGHPDFASVILRYSPGKTCVELKSLKLYYQSFRNEGIYYEAVTNLIRDDLTKLMNPIWLQLMTQWRGRGGIRSCITATTGDVPEAWQRD
jgi:7-cyano-7-deazaguanine reductase